MITSNRYNNSIKTGEMNHHKINVENDDEDDKELRVEGDELLKEIAQAVTGFSTLPDEDIDRHKLEMLSTNQRENRHHVSTKTIQLIQMLGEAYLQENNNSGNDEDSESIAATINELSQKLTSGNPFDPETFEIVSQITESIQESVTTLLNDSTMTANKLGNMVLSDQQKQIQQNDERRRNNQQEKAVNRPQDSFNDIDNSRSPFIPKLKSKPNAIVDLPPNSSSSSSSSNSSRDVFLNTEQLMVNPYETEIRGASLSPPSWLLKQNTKKPKPFKKLHEVKYQYVDTIDELKKMVGVLEKEMAIAVDLENHSMRSFQGFVCLMQISTHDADYLVDAIKLRNHMQLLNIIFTNPNIIKVLHGADYDVEWLQRDFGIYIVSLFDTGQASRVLEYKAYSLAFSMQYHCGVNPNKAFQLADWRIRPLTEPMVKYAREDTRYLLFIFENMRNELFEKAKNISNTPLLGAKYPNIQPADLVIEVINRSANIALKCYEKPIFRTDGYRDIIAKGSLKLSAIQTKVFERLYEWRDRVAREMDESVHYILSISLMTKLSTEIPQTIPDVEKCIAMENGKISSIYRSQMQSILQVILDVVHKQEQVSGVVQRPSQSNLNQRFNQGNNIPISSSSSRRTTVPATLTVPEQAQQSMSTVSMGVNRTKMVFTPISSSPTLSNPHLFQSYDQSHHPMNDEKRQAGSSSDSNRASPTLTTDQLFETAGWRDVAENQRRIGNMARTTQTTGNIGHSGFTKHFSRDQAISSNNNQGLLSKLQGFVANNKSTNNSLNLAASLSSSSQSSGSGATSILESVTLKDIYDLSNQSRKKMKGKKKVNENAESGGKEDDRASGNYDMNSASSSTAGKKDPETFMKSIGWIAEGEEAPKSSRMMDIQDPDHSPDENPSRSDSGGSSSEKRRKEDTNMMSLKQMYGNKDSLSSSDKSNKKQYASSKSYSKPPSTNSSQRQSDFQYTKEHAKAAGVIPAAPAMNARDKSRKKN